MIVGGLLFMSGQVGTDPATGKLVEGGVQKQDVVKTTCFLADIQDFGAFNEIYRQYFTGKPARSCFAVKDLPMGAQVEIEVIVSMENK